MRVKSSCKHCGMLSRLDGWCLNCGRAYRGATAFHEATEALGPVDRIKATLLLHGAPVKEWSMNLILFVPWFVMGCAWSIWGAFSGDGTIAVGGNIMLLVCAVWNDLKKRDGE